MQAQFREFHVHSHLPASCDVWSSLSTWLHWGKPRRWPVSECVWRDVSTDDRLTGQQADREGPLWMWTSLFSSACPQKQGTLSASVLNSSRTLLDLMLCIFPRWYHYADIRFQVPDPLSMDSWLSKGFQAFITHCGCVMVVLRLPHAPKSYWYVQLCSLKTFMTDYLVCDCMRQSPNNTVGQLHPH